MKVAALRAGSAVGVWNANCEFVAFDLKPKASKWRPSYQSLFEGVTPYDLCRGFRGDV